MVSEIEERGQLWPRRLFSVGIIPRAFATPFAQTASPRRLRAAGEDPAIRSALDDHSGDKTNGCLCHEMRHGDTRLARHSRSACTRLPDASCKRSLLRGSDIPAPGDRFTLATHHDPQVARYGTRQGTNDLFGLHRG